LLGLEEKRYSVYPGSGTKRKSEMPLLARGSKGIRRRRKLQADAKGFCGWEKKGEGMASEKGERIIT